MTYQACLKRYHDQSTGADIQSLTFKLICVSHVGLSCCNFYVSQRHQKMDLTYTLSPLSLKEHQTPSLALPVTITTELSSQHCCTAALGPLLTQQGTHQDVVVSTDADFTNVSAGRMGGAISWNSIFELCPQWKNLWKHVGSNPLCKKIENMKWNFFFLKISPRAPHQDGRCKRRWKPLGVALWIRFNL